MANLKWTVDMIRESANKCSGREDFRKKFCSGYAAARRLGMLNDLFPVVRVETKWTEELIRGKSSDFTSRSKFAKSFPGAVKAATRLGILDDIFPLTRRKVTEQVIRDAAAECSSLNEFIRKFPVEYAKSLKLGITREIVPVIPRRNWRYKWTEDEIRRVASLCSSRVEFIKKFGGAYNAAISLGIADDVIAHSFTQWTRESVSELAKQFKRKTDFQSAHKGAYVYAHRHGFIDDLFEDQSRCNTRCCVYIWKVVDDTDLYKIGITSRNIETARIDMVAKKAGMQSDVITLVQVGSKQARRVEKKLKQLGIKEKFVEKFDGCTEFRRLSPSEIAKCFEIISKHTIERII